MYNSSELNAYSGNSNLPLSKEICDYMGIDLSPIEIKKFADGETFVKIPDSVRGGDCFVIQSTSPNVNENVMELLLIIDALKRASAERITAVIPYFGYARQDRKDQPRVPISAKLVANLLTIAGADRVLTMDLHVDQIQGFFDIPMDHLYAAPVFIEEYLKNKDYDLLVSPDIGGVARTRGLAKRLGKDIAIIDKRRRKHNQSEVMNIIGNIKGKRLILYDDIMDTGGTAVNAARALMEKGAVEVNFLAVHGLFSGPCYERLKKSVINEVATTNSIRQKNDLNGKIKIYSVAKIFGESIMRIHENKSISSLFV